jgi:hypothetical protein
MERSASPAEAAAIVAAVERFVAAQLAPQAEPVMTTNAWTRAALLEGVGAKRMIKDLEGGMR